MISARPVLDDALSASVLEPGAVALVGGGPGAWDLITVRGLDLLRQADVVVADRLGPRALLDELTETLEDALEVDESDFYMWRTPTGAEYPARQITFTT